MRQTAQQRDASKSAGDRHGSLSAGIVEPTISDIKAIRRMRVQYDHSSTVVDAFAALTASIVCFHIIQEKFSPKLVA